MTFASLARQENETTMHWNYRIVRHADGSLALYETYYDDDGRPHSRTAEPTTFGCDADEGTEELVASLERATHDARQPVLDDAEISGTPDSANADCIHGEDPDAMRAAGFELVQMWVPDTKSPKFIAEARRQSRLVAANSDPEEHAFMDTLAEDALRDAKPANTMAYRGHYARIEYDGDDEIFVSGLIGIRDGVHFHATTIGSLKQAFHEAVDDYLDLCSRTAAEPT